MSWFVLDINPEPWVIGPVGSGRKNGKMYAYVGRNQQLDTYKEGVKEALGDGHELIEGPVRIQFWFWRNMAEYTTPQARSHRKHEADLTNMQKSTEDALQGVLFKNDKDVKVCTSVVVDQGPDVRGMIVMNVHALSPGWDVGKFPLQVQQKIDEITAVGPLTEWEDSDEEDLF
jgi:Holliday junction resolvase RusA-like endonuclease